MAKPIAVMGCQLTSTFGGQVQITSTPSTSVLIDNKGVYRGPVMVMVTAEQGPGCTGPNANSLGPGTITPTSVFTKADNMAVVLQGDQAATVPMMGVGPNGVPVNYTTSVTVVSAGQTSVLAD